MPLTESQKAIVKSTAPILREQGVAITTLFYRQMLEAHPEYRNVFNLSNQKSGDQPRALANAVLAYAEHIDRLEALGGAVEHIAQRHASLCIEPDMYPVVGHHLISAIAQVLGDAVTPEIAEAWTAAYGQLADILMGRERQLYDDAGEWAGWRKFKVDKREKESESVESFYLVPVDGKTPLPAYKPGQYASVRVPVPELDGTFQCRQYSMSTGPKRDHLRISVKREHASEADAKAGLVPGVVSNLLHSKYAVGEVVELTIPRGEFTVDVADASKADVPLVLICAGVGVTPIMSIFETVLSPESKVSSRPIRWIQAARDTTEMPFERSVREIAEKKDNVSMAVFVKNVTQGDVKGRDYDFAGKLDLRILDKERDLGLRDARTDYYVCGPQQFMLNVRDTLMGMGVEREQINFELFGTGDVEKQ